MKTRFGMFAGIAALNLLCTPVYAQWINMPGNAKPNLSAAAPKSVDGHPDLSGIWVAADARYTVNVASDLKPGDVPFQPWSQALVAQRADGSHSGEDPYANCLPSGVPRVNATPQPWK